MHSFSFRSHRVSYVEAGSGQPMIFLHNGGSGHWTWLHQIEHFSKTHRVLALDLLGCGSSDRPAMTYDLDLYVDMLREFIEQLGLREIILCGNCIGAAIAFEYATRDSSRVSRLILFNLCGGRPMMNWDLALISTPWPRWMEPLHRAAMWIFARIPGIQQIALRRYYGDRDPDHSDPVFVAESREAANPAQTLPRVNLTRGIPSFEKFSHDFERPVQLPPTLLFWGEANRVLKASEGRVFSERLRPNRARFISGLGHLMMAEDPTGVNAEIEVFLRDSLA